MNPVDAILLRRDGLVFLEPQNKRASTNLFDAFENEILALGFTLSFELRKVMTGADDASLEKLRLWLLPQLRNAIGVPNAQPLFRQFPRNIPKDTWKLYVECVMAYWLQAPEQPCVICGNSSSVQPVNPCGHLVCSQCWDGGNYSGCPICHRHIDASDPFLKPAPAPKKLQLYTNSLKRLDLGADKLTRIERITSTMLQKTTPLTPQEKSDLLEIIRQFGAKMLEWLPARIPIKETMALCLASVLRDPQTWSSKLEVLQTHLKTSTDVLRLLAVLNGEDGSLTPVSKQTKLWVKQIEESIQRIDPGYRQYQETYFQSLIKQYFPKQKSLPRTARKGLLGILEQFALPNLIEDMKRYPNRWKRAGEMLHPLEYSKRFPKTALAFSILRGQTKLEPKVKERFQAVADVPNLNFFNNAYRYSSWANRVEYALANRILESLPKLLNERPGEYARRLDHALRLGLERPIDTTALLEAFKQIVPRLTSPMLLQLQAHFAARGQRLRRRVFFPKSEVMLSYALKDKREILPDSTLEPVCSAMLEELLSRASHQTKFATALLDSDLAELLVPFSERSSSKALIALPRGSTQSIPDGQWLRLFMHWMQQEPYRVDLDLSFSFFDTNWKFVEKCDFTNLAAKDNSYIHSGDYTDAPAPYGATEYIDLHLEKLLKTGIRYAMMIVFSYNSVPFDQMPYAFAGVMQRTDKSGEIFEPRTVQNRFDLSGNAQIAIPLYLDLQTRKLQWLDIKLNPEGMNHQVGGYYQKLSAIGKDFQNYFLSGTRATLWQLACLHAAARSQTVLIRKANEVRRFEKGDSSDFEFYQRIVQQQHGVLEQAEFTTPMLSYVVRADFTPPENSEMYALYWNDTTNAISKKRASDLVDQLSLKTINQT
jgi:Prokaryotic RING finger family 4